MAPNIPVGRSFSGFIDLPMLSGDVTVGGALDTMVANMRSAVIVDVGRFHYLHTARSVLTAPKLVHPDDALLSVLSATGAPYFPVVDPSSDVPWMTLSTDPKVLLRHGIIETVPNGRVRIGGLITSSAEGTAHVLMSRRFPIRDFTLIITKCKCSGGHSILPEEVVNGKCPHDGFDVNCG